MAPVDSVAPVVTPRVVLIDPGHGGQDPGAVHGGLVESRWTLDYARQLRRGLLGRGWPIAIELTRDADEDLSLHARGALAAKHGADLVISLHFNASADPATQGLMVFCREDDSIGESVAAHILPHVPLELRRPRNAYFRCAPGGEVWLSRALHVLERFAPVPSVLVELAHLTNAGDREELQRLDVQAGVVAAICAGVDHWLTLTGARGIAARGGRPMVS